MYTKNALLIDLSHYNAVVDFEKLKAAGVTDVILKAGGCETGKTYDDSKFAQRVQDAHDAGFLGKGAYYFGSAKYWLERQHTMSSVERLSDEQHGVLQHIFNVLRHKEIYYLAIDMEDASEGKQTTSSWHAFFVRDLVDRLRRQMAKGNLRTMKLGVYSRRSWIDSKAPDLSTYLSTQPDLFIWCANWAGGKLTVKSIAEIAKERPVTGHQPMPFGWSAARVKQWDIWQWAGDSGYGYKCSDAITTVYGAPGHVDLNLYNGSAEEYETWIGLKPTVPVTPPVAEEPQPPSDESGKLEELLERVKRMEEEIKAIRSHFS